MIRRRPAPRWFYQAAAAAGPVTDAQPRSGQVYEDWAVLLGTDRPISWLQSCTVDEFIDLVARLHKVSREALIALAGSDGNLPPPALEQPDAVLLGCHLAGAHACYSHCWSPYAQGAGGRLGRIDFCTGI